MEAMMSPPMELSRWYEIYASAMELESFEQVQLSNALLALISQNSITEGQVLLPPTNIEHDITYAAPLDTAFEHPNSQTSSSLSSSAASISSTEEPHTEPVRLFSQPLVASEGDESPWPEASASSDIIPLTTTLPHNHVHEVNDRKAVLAHNPSMPFTYSTNSTKGRFHCPLCLELDVRVSFNAKHDSKRHLHNFHEAKFEWFCSSCSEFFDRDRDFRKHFRKCHHGQLLPQNNRHSVPDKCVYACGFTDCRWITYNFKDWWDHVARCMKEKPVKEWSYTWRMRNLLRHPRIAPTWKHIRSHWCESRGIDTSKLQWDPKITRSIRQQLESHVFESTLEELLEKLLVLGLRNSNPRLDSVFLPDQKQPTSTSSAGYQPTPPAAEYFPFTQDTFPQHDQGRMQFFDKSYSTTTLPPENMSYGRRNVLMTDVPSPSSIDPNTSQAGNSAPLDQDNISWQNFLYTDTYSTNTTRPLPDEPNNSTAGSFRVLRSSSRCNF
ncbi:hypothetical protein CC78DRAFT_617137 [Lojkania enalia]|uniref:C2H2-type domain-containing protein n=1 Tax=Lojkania enalia TaxID=147567 RepID=A0A9P4KA84_9PLEO|nr:hypothetical protein CC78DRAFT_617137 [Didymosphaeria enalia]